MIQICENWSELVSWCWDKGIYVDSTTANTKLILDRDAACHYAEMVWQDDQRDVDYFSTEVEALEDDDTIKTFYCTAETNINFCATEMTSDD